MEAIKSMAPPLSIGLVYIKETFEIYLSSTFKLLFQLYKKNQIYKCLNVSSTAAQSILLSFQTALHMHNS